MPYCAEWEIGLTKLDIRTCFMKIEKKERNNLKKKGKWTNSPLSFTI